jgi:hypothetical protein
MRLGSEAQYVQGKWQRNRDWTGRISDRQTEVAIAKKHILHVQISWQRNRDCSGRNSDRQTEVANAKKQILHVQNLCQRYRFCTGRISVRQTVKVKVYTGIHQRALRKGSQLVLALARAPPKDKKEKQQRLMRIRRVVSHAIRPAPSPPEASRSTSTPPSRSPIITVAVVKVYYMSCFCDLV